MGDHINPSVAKESPLIFLLRNPRDIDRLYSAGEEGSSRGARVEVLKCGRLFSVSFSLFSTLHFRRGLSEARCAHFRIGVVREAESAPAVSATTNRRNHPAPTIHYPYLAPSCPGFRPTSR